MDKKWEKQIKERVMDRFYAKEERKLEEMREKSVALMAQSVKQLEEEIIKEKSKQNNHSIIKKYNNMQEKMKQESENSAKL